jgi:hypothetical protein
LLPPDAQAPPGEVRAREEQRALLLLSLHSKFGAPAGHSGGAGVGNGADGGVGAWGVGGGNGALGGAFPHLASPSLALQGGAAADRCSPDVHEAASGHDGRGGRGAPAGGHRLLYPATCTVARPPAPHACTARLRDKPAPRTCRGAAPRLLAAARP